MLQFMLQEGMIRSLPTTQETGASLTEQAYLIIRDRILRGVFPLGAPLSRRGLAQDLEMSVFPISDALQRLESDGLVESRPRAGTRVRVPTEEEIREQFVLREALEAQSARLCAEKATFQERLELRRTAENVDALFASAEDRELHPGLLFSLYNYHFDFHIKIADCSHSTALRVAIEKNHVLVMNWLYAGAANLEGMGAHQALIEVITSTDALAADMAMREHVRLGLEALVKSLRVRMVKKWRVTSD